MVQWILDHPSSRWPDFQVSTAENSAYAFPSRYSERYFRHFCLPGSATSVVAGVGPNKRSRVPALNPKNFLAREYACLVALNLSRLGKPIEKIQDEIDGLERKLRDAVMEASSLAQEDLILPIEIHACAVLANLGILLRPRELHGFVQMVEDKVQAFRRLYVLKIARDYPVLIQSDDTARAMPTAALHFSQRTSACGEPCRKSRRRARL